jgi:hypothetical protein
MKPTGLLCFVSDPDGAVRSVDLHWGSACCTFPDRAPQRHRAALATIAAAMRAHPEPVGSSTGRVDTELMRTNGTLVAKSQKRAGWAKAARRVTSASGMPMDWVWR